jgi:predicted acetyltransferase
VYQGRAGAVEGYLSYESETTSDVQTVTVHEICGATESARRALVGWVARFGEHRAQVVWEASPQDLQHFGLFSLPFFEGSQPQIALRPGMMLRLVDLAGALSRMHGTHYAPVLDNTGGTLTIRASDAIRSQNERPVRLHRSGVHAGVQTDREWIAADISVLAQLYVGYQTPSEAAALGLLRVSSPETLALADRLFPARQPYVSPMDQF